MGNLTAPYDANTRFDLRASPKAVIRVAGMASDPMGFQFVQREEDLGLTYFYKAVFAGLSNQTSDIGYTDNCIGRIYVAFSSYVMGIVQ